MANTDIMKKMVSELTNKGLITNKSTTTKVDNNTSMLAKGNEPTAKTSTEKGKDFTPTVTAKSGTLTDKDIQQFKDAFTKTETSFAENKKKKETASKYTVYDDNYSENTNALRNTYLAVDNSKEDLLNDPIYQRYSADPSQLVYATPTEQQRYAEVEKQLTDTANFSRVLKGDYGTAKELEDTSKGGKIKDADVFTIDENGVSMNDYTNEKNDLANRKKELKDQIAKLNAQGFTTTNLEEELAELEKQEQDIADKEKYQDARYRSLVYEYSKQNGTPDELTYMARRQGSYGNTALEDVALGLTASNVGRLGGLISMYEGVANATQYASLQEIQDIQTIRDENQTLVETDPVIMKADQIGFNELTDDEKKHWEEVSQKVADNNNRIKELEKIADEKYAQMDKQELGRQFTEIANELQFMQQNGESQTKKLIVNTIVQVADNLALQGVGIAAAGEAGMKAGTALMSASAFGQTYAEDMANGYSPTQALGHASLSYGTEYMTEQIGGERMFKVFESSKYAPMTFGSLMLESAKSGGAESAEEAVGWAIDPVLDMVVTGNVPSLESWDINQLGESISVAFLAGMTQSTVMSANSVISNYANITTQEGKLRAQDVLKELAKMRQDAETTPITREDGTVTSEAEFIDIFSDGLWDGIQQYEAKTALGDAIQFQHENVIDGYTEKVNVESQEATQVSKDQYVESLNAQAELIKEQAQYSDEAKERIAKQEAEGEGNYQYDDEIRNNLKGLSEETINDIVDRYKSQVENSERTLYSGEEGLIYAIEENGLPLDYNNNDDYAIIAHASDIVTHGGLSDYVDVTNKSDHVTIDAMVQALMENYKEGDKVNTLDWRKISQRAYELSQNQKTIDDVKYPTQRDEFYYGNEVTPNNTQVEETAPQNNVDENDNETIDAVTQSEEAVDNGAKVLEDPEGAQEEAEEKIAQVLTENPNSDDGKLTVKEMVDKAKYWLSDFGVYVDNYAKKVNNPEISHKYDYMLSSQGLANNALVNGHYDIYGRQIDKGISKVFEGIEGQVKEDFYNYLYHWRNYDEMSIGKRKYGKLENAIQENAKEILTKNFGVVEFDGKHYLSSKQDGQDIKVEITDEAYADLQNRALKLAEEQTSVDRPVFGESVTAEDSKKAIAEYESKYNGEGTFDFKKLAKEVWDYERNELQLLMQYEIASEEEYNRMVSTSTHWVPIQREVDERPIGGSMNANKVLKGFKGSNEDILPLDEIIMKRTSQVYRSITQNNLFNEIFKTTDAKKTKGGNFEISNLAAENLGLSQDGKKHYITLYKNGQGIKLEVGEDMYNSLKVHKTYKAPVVSTLADLRRNTITGWNPIFWVTNGMKDIQDVPYNTKFSASEYTRAYLAAWKEISNNGDLYQLYLANGGGQNSIKKLGETTKLPKELKGLAGFGENIETTPRLAEFIATINKGGTIEEAMHNAAEVTTNFKRGGTVSKTLNANGFTFLNASIVGAQKQMTNYKEAYEKNGIIGVASYMAKMGFLYNAPIMLLNYLRWKDDEDYEQLSEYVKQNYYCLWKTDNGTFIRIPKGRLNAFYQTVIQSKIDTITGKKTLWEALLTDWSSFQTNIAPNSLSESSLFAPLVQAFFSGDAGETWYGGDIVPTRLQNVPDAEQFDASTDNFSKWLGEKTGLSPMKINYAIDQYTGVAGDFILPMLTLEAENGIDPNYLSALAAPVLDKFTTNSVLKNQYVTDFYNMNEELQKNANSSKATDEDILAYRYMSTITSKLSELYKQKREIQNDETLKNSEKYDKVLEVQKQIDILAKYGLENYDQMDIAGNYADVAGVQYYKNEDGWKKLTEDQLKRIEGLNLTTQEKSDFYSLYNSIGDKREELKNATPDGQDADYGEMTIEAIQNSNLSNEAKNKVYDSYYGSNFSGYVNSMDFDSATKLQIKFIYSTTDSDKDENGNTISNSKAQKIKDKYVALGVYDQIIKYIKENGLSYTSFGLSKTVVGDTAKKTTNNKEGKSSYTKAYTKAMSSNKANLETNSSKVSTNTTKSKSSSNSSKSAFSEAYSKAMNSTAKSTDSDTVYCQKCGHNVKPINGKCPICGANL